MMDKAIIDQIILWKPTCCCSKFSFLLVEELIPLFGLPEVLLQDRNTNVLSYVMQDLRKKLETKKLNKTAYYFQCDGMVEHFNRKFKPSTLCKYAVTYGNQCLLCAYKNVPHDFRRNKLTT